MLAHAINPTDNPSVRRQDHFPFEARFCDQQQRRFVADKFGRWIEPVAVVPLALRNPNGSDLSPVEVTILVRPSKYMIPFRMKESPSS